MLALTTASAKLALPVLPLLIRERWFGLVENEFPGRVVKMLPVAGAAGRIAMIHLTTPTNLMLTIIIEFLLSIYLRRRYPNPRS